MSEITVHMHKTAEVDRGAVIKVASEFAEWLESEGFNIEPATLPNKYAGDGYTELAEAFVTFLEEHNGGTLR